MDDDPDKILLDKLHALFAVVIEFVYESGGDGDGWIVSENYKALARAFGEWRVDKGWLGSVAFGTYEEREDQISFYDNQESVHFVGDRTQLAPWAGDIIVESKHFGPIGRRDA